MKHPPNGARRSGYTMMRKQFAGHGLKPDIGSSGLVEDIKIAGLRAT